MSFPVAFKWIGLALLGIVIAAAVAIAASRLASQQIGLASEPISAGDALAPARLVQPTAKHRRQAHGTRKPPATLAPTPSPAPAPEPTVTSPLPAPTTEASPAPSPPSGPSGGGDGEHGGGGGGGGGGADD